jgi:predicted Zn-dependent peptidase
MAFARPLAAPLLLALTVILAAGAAAQQPDRLSPPEPGPPSPLSLPPIRKFSLSNGLPVWVVSMREVPIVDVLLIVKSGGGAEPAGQLGVASLTAAMLDEGAGERGALELADAVEFLGASLTTSSSYDASTVRLHTPVARLDDALPLMADVVLRPTFPERELERLRQERLTSILQTRDNPASLASTALSRLLYGPEHRYGTAIIGTETSLKALTVAAVREYYAAFYRPQHAHLLVVGDVAADAVQPALERAFGGWSADGAPPARAASAARKAATRRIYLIDRPDAPQTEIRVGAIAAARDTPDYFPIQVLNTILGGAFMSRLNQNLREEHGYSYGAWSYFDMRKAPGPFVAQAGVQSDRTVESVREFLNELGGTHEPVPADELTRARDLQALGLPAAFETTGGMAGNLATLVIYDLPETFFTEYVARVEAVTAEDVRRAASEHLQTDRLTIVIVGDRKTIEQPLRQADVGAVEIVTADDVLR